MFSKKSKTNTNNYVAIDSNTSSIKVDADISFSRNGKSRKKIWIIFITAAVVLITAGTVYGYYLFTEPTTFFPQIDNTPAQEIPVTNDTVTEQEETVSFSGIVNIMLIGIDSNAERQKIAKNNPNAEKTDMHSDVMIILAINFDKNRVDMISLPRDTYAKIYGVEGYYKLNAAINCADMPYPDESSINKLIKTAEWMLGDRIPIDYYIGVDMPAIIDLVDAIGGVDYDVDIDFAGNDAKTRIYTKGMRHMDGQAVLDYLRTRKSNLTEASQQGDINRIKRQKNMLLTIFKKLKTDGSLLQIPKILKAFEGRVATNLDLPQIAFLTNWAYKLDEKNDIGMHAMDGQSRIGLFLWNFIVTDQENRVKLIKEIYGIDVPEYTEYSPKYVTNLWNQMAGSYARSNARIFYNKYNIPVDETEIDPSASPDVSVSPRPSGSIRPYPSRTPNLSPDETGSSDTPVISQTEVLSPTPKPTPSSDEDTGGLSMKNTNLLLGINKTAAKPKATNPYADCFTEKERIKVESILNSSDVFKIRQVCESVNRFGHKFGAWGPNVMKDNQVKVNPN